MSFFRCIITGGDKLFFYDNLYKKAIAIYCKRTKSNFKLNIYSKKNVVCTHWNIFENVQTFRLPTKPNENLFNIHSTFYNYLDDGN